VPLEVSEGFDHRRHLKGSVPSAYVDLPYNSGGRQASDGVVRGGERAPGMNGRRADSEQWRSRKSPQQPVSGRTGSHGAKARAPFVLKSRGRGLEPAGVIDSRRTAAAKRPTQVFMPSCAALDDAGPRYLVASRPAM
jgi:hypothetical protein